MPGNLITIMDADGEMVTVTGGKLDVNASVSGSGDGTIQDGVNSAIEATVFDGASANPLAVSLVDQNGDAVAVGGGTQYTEDAAAAADPVGTALMMVRDDALSGQTTTDGDNVAARGTDKGELYVKHADTIAVTQSGTWDEVGIHDSGNSITVDGTITANLSATDNAVLDQIELNTDPLLVVGSGTEATAIRVTIATDSTGVLSVDDNGGALTVDGTVTAAGDVGTLDQLDLTNTNPLAVAIVDGDGTQITSFGGGTQYTEGDTDASITGTALLFEGAADTLVAAPGTAANGLDVDVTRVSGTVTVDGSGVTQPISAASLPLPTGAATSAAQLPDGHNVTVDNAAGASAVNIQDGGNSITVDGSLTVDLGANNDVTVTSGTIDVIGTVADDSTTPGDPVMVGGQAVSPDGTDPSSVAENDVVRFRTDLNRRLYVATNHPRTWRYHLNTSTAQTDTSIQAAPGAGLRVVITNIQFTSGAATAINLFLEEGTTTIWGPIYLEAVAGRGYVSGPIFLPITANTAVTYTTSAAIAQAIDILGFIEAV